MFLEVLKKFEITVNTITTDNAPNIVFAADNLLNENETLPIKAIRYMPYFEFNYTGWL